MSNLSHERTVADFATENLARTRVFENFGIDYCCGGEIPLADACERQGISTEQVLQAIAECDRNEPQVPVKLADAAIGDLVASILNEHHAFLWSELPRLDELHVHVSGHHAAQQPYLMRSLEVYRELRSELEDHMRKEEQFLFPLCSALDDSAVPELMGVISSMLEKYEEEHKQVGLLLSELHSMHNGYAITEGMCRKQQALLSRLAQLEEDIHLHVYKENHILFNMLRERVES